MDIFGIPITINTTPISVSQATNIEVIVTAYIIPIQYLPLLIYAIVAVFGVAIIYLIARSLTKKKPAPPASPEKSAAQSSATIFDRSLSGVCKPPVGYHLDEYKGLTYAMPDGGSPTSGDLLKYDKKHSVWVNIKWSEERAR